MIFTVGHSTRAIDEFIGLLQPHGVVRLADVRTIPKSRYNPQFNREELAKSLREVGIHYTHLPALGGLRHPRKDSINTAWRNRSFRGYADYMQTPEFERGIGTLLELATQEPLAIMCAEAVPWRCHRSLIADVLIVREIPVEEILAGGRLQPHKLTPFAHVDGAHITYPGEPQLELSL
jgi:uncharacterized protein (DUF488 family)